MIHQLHGVLLEKSPRSCLVDVGGVGYGVSIPVSTFENLPETGEDVRLWTYLYLREDQLSLFGFATPRERQAFETLIGVSGVGPKLALSVISALPVSELVRSVMAGDVATLTRVPGVGRKTAERLALELRSKVAGLAESGMEGATSGAPFASKSGPQEEAIQALMALGASRVEAQRRVAEAVRQSGEMASVETLVSAAMRAGR